MIPALQVTSKGGWTCFGGVKQFSGTSSMGMVDLSMYTLSVKPRSTSPASLSQICSVTAHGDSHGDSQGTVSRQQG